MEGRDVKQGLGMVRYMLNNNKKGELRVRR